MNTTITFLENFPTPKSRSDIIQNGERARQKSANLPPAAVIFLAVTLLVTETRVNLYSISTIRHQSSDTWYLHFKKTPVMRQVAS